MGGYQQADSGRRSVTGGREAYTSDQQTYTVILLSVRVAILSSEPQNQCEYTVCLPVFQLKITKTTENIKT